MASPSYTYTLANSTTADADEVMQNFNDILNGVSDGSKDLSISALTVAGNANFNGNTTLGNATGDTITVTGRIASTVNPSASATYGLGSSALAWTGLYLDNGATDGGGVYFDAGSTKYVRSNAAGTELQLGGFTTLETGGAQQKEFAIYLEGKSADYTILDNDGLSAVNVTTSTTNRTVTLPTAADNTGRLLHITKIDSGSGTVTVDGEGAETINGAASKLLNYQYATVSVLSNGTAWYQVGRSHYTETKALDTDFTAGNLHMVRSGNVVTLTFSAVTHASDASVNSSSGFIPTAYRPPQDQVVAVYASATTIQNFYVNSSGLIQILYRNYSGTLTAQTNGVPCSITFVKTDA